MKTFPFKFFLLVVFPLAIGWCVYLIHQRVALPFFIRNYLPDALWSFSFTAALYITGITRGKKFATVCSVLLIASLLELMQQYAAGTYDSLDLLAYAIGAFAVFIIPIPQKHKPQSI